MTGVAELEVGRDEIGSHMVPVQPPTYACTFPLDRHDLGPEIEEAAVLTPGRDPPHTQNHSGPGIWRGGARDLDTQGPARRSRGGQRRSTSAGTGCAGAIPDSPCGIDVSSWDDVQRVLAGFDELQQEMRDSLVARFPQPAIISVAAPSGRFPKAEHL